MRMIMAVFVRMLVAMVMMLEAVNSVGHEVDVKLHPGDGGFLPARNVEMVAVKLELLQLAFELGGIHAEIQQRADEHVTGDAAENVEVKRFHGKFISATDAHRLTQMAILHSRSVCVSSV
jgi:hypothetical protein